jgi:Ca2+-binding RTX toxin-like protein
MPQISRIELLEDRRLFSIHLIDGALTINGGPGNDVINLGIGSQLSAPVDGIDDRYYYQIKINGRLKDISFSRVQRVIVRGGKGNDAVALFGDAFDGPINPLRRGATVFGGAGNDTLFGGIGDDHLYGQGGDDRIQSWDGHLFGGKGNDNLGQQCGSDAVELGGPGNDSLNGGKDLHGGPGKDAFYNSDHKRIKDAESGEIVDWEVCVDYF